MGAIESRREAIGSRTRGVKTHASGRTSDVVRAKTIFSYLVAKSKSKKVGQTSSPKSSKKKTLSLNNKSTTPISLLPTEIEKARCRAGGTIPLCQPTQLYQNPSPNQRLPESSRSRTPITNPACLSRPPHCPAPPLSRSPTVPPKSPTTTKIVHNRIFKYGHQH